MDFIVPDNFQRFEFGWQHGIDFAKEADAFLNALNSATKENDIQRYIKTNKKWFIPASLFKDYDFGHHEAYLVPEQALGIDYRVDYMLLGRNSIGYHIVFVEFEDVNIDYRIKSANIETMSVRKGLAQLKDWQRWIDENKDYFMRSCGLAGISRNIPSWGIQYCLVVGRRKRMDEVSNQMRRQAERDHQLHIVSYDRLVDNIRLLCNGF